ncbi:MAG: NTP transferase domain-containing protein, partial [Eubacteriales bacterium]|nr:NTP transferase domain-containing protein [Eubacteriales bacterium]
GSGKTTLCGALRPADAPGITTCALPKKEVRLRENATGEEAVIGKYDESLPGSENRMRLCREGLEGLGVQALERCADAAAEWAVLDEIGYLECGCEAYREALLRLMERKRLLAAVRKQELPFLLRLCSDREVFCVDLDAPYGRAGCVIMASGMGRRFGGNKLLADFHGEPLFLRALAATEGIFARRVVVTRHADVAEICRARGVEAVLHDRPLRSDTVRIGLEAVGDVDGCLFCPADQPLLRRESVAALAIAAANAPQQIFRACFADEPGSPVLFPKWAFAELNALPEGKGGGHVMKKHPESVRMVPVRDAHELMDADDLDALEMLRAIKQK